MEIIVVHPEKENLLKKEDLKNSIIIRDENTIIPTIYMVYDEGTSENLNPKIKVKKYTNCHVKFCEAMANQSFSGGENRFYDLIGTYRNEEVTIERRSLDWIYTIGVTTKEEARKRYKEYIKEWDNHIYEIRARLFEDMQNKFNKLK